MPEHAPSPSKPKMSEPESVRLLSEPDELFWTPTSESSTPSKGGWLASTEVVTDPSGLTVNSTAQPVSYPTGGHCENAADAVPVAKSPMPTAATKTRTTRIDALCRRRFNSSSFSPEGEVCEWIGRVIRSAGRPRRHRLLPRF